MPKSDLVVENGRVKGVTMVKPIVYGNIARYFSRKREQDGHTHQWTVYLKPYHNEDMSKFIKKVHFKLHESYANPNRIITRPPYEVSETGWGEFECVIRVYFEDSNEKPIVIYHVLKLFQNEPLIIAGKKDLVSEFYDELVFQEPTLSMYKALANPQPILSSASSYTHATDFDVKKRQTLKAITEAKLTVREEVVQMTQCLKEAKDFLEDYKRKLAALPQSDEKIGK